MTEDGREIDPSKAATGERFGTVPHRVRYAARSDRGLVRLNNQDSVFAGDRMMVIADGMGGHAAGDTASRLVVAAFAPLDEQDPGADLLAPLKAATREGNAAIAEVVQQHPDLDGMGTTVTALLFDGNRMGIAHVGDSRAYLYRSGVLHQLTRDDTFVQSLVDDGRITEDEASRHPQRNLLLRALNGTDLDPALILREVRAGDRFMICSDGLSGVVAPEAVADALAEEDPARAADILIELALVGGGPDNVTVVVADVIDTGATAAPVPVPAVSDDPDATGPIQGLHMTREMPRIPLPPISDRPAAAPDFAGGDNDLGDSDLGDSDLGDDDLGDDDDFDDDGVLDGDGAADERGAFSGTAGSGDVSGGRPGSASRSRSEAARVGVDPPVRRWRRRGALTLAICALAMVALGSVVLWSRSQYYVGSQAGQVTVFRGVNGSVLGLRLSSPQEDSCAGAAAGCVPVTLDDLQPAARDQVLAGIQAGNLADARQVMGRLAGQLLPPCPPVAGADTTVASTPATSGTADTGSATTGPTTVPAMTGPAMTGPATTRPATTVPGTTRSITTRPGTTGPDTGSGRTGRSPSDGTRTTGMAPATAPTAAARTGPTADARISTAVRTAGRTTAAAARDEAARPAQLPAGELGASTSTITGPALELLAERGSPNTVAAPNGAFGQTRAPAAMAAANLAARSGPAAVSAADATAAAAAASGAATAAHSGSTTRSPPAAGSPASVVSPDGTEIAAGSVTPTVTVTQTVPGPSAPSGIPLAPLPAQPGITCRVIG